MSERLDRVRDTLLVHCEPVDAYAALALADRPGAGVVVSTRKRSDVWALAEVAERRGIPFLVDAGRYTGKWRRPASDRFDRGWLRMQRDLGIPVLTDSGYIAAHDVAGLANVLDQARALGDVTAVLPLNSSWWFDRKGGLDCLVDHVDAAQVPIALVLEHSGDPLGVGRTLDGLLALLRVGVPVLSLRSDTSGLGLLCHGAHAAAVGTRSGLRHPYPMTTGGGRGRSPSTSTIVQECLAYITIDKIVLAIAADPDSSLWTACTCPSCNGRQLDTIVAAPAHRQVERAFGHALHTLFDLRDHLVGRTTDPAARRISWREHCSSALTRYLELDDAGQQWTVPAFLRNWYRVPVPTMTPDRGR